MMVDVKNYRSCTDYREILRVLQKASNQADNFIWQSTALGKNIVPIHHFEIDFVTREVNVFFDSIRFKIDLELPVYMKLDYKVSVFKVNQFNVTQNSISFSFPTEIKSIEFRQNPRAILDLEKEKFIVIRPAKSHYGDAHQLKVRALDASTDGLGILVSDNNRTFLKNNRIIFITELQNKVLETPILAEVVYINNDVHPRFSARKEKNLKVGLKLSSLFPPQEFHEFIQ